MKKSRFTEEQIVGMLWEHDAGAQTSELCRATASAEGEVGLGASVAQRLKTLEDEKRRLKKLVHERAARVRAGRGEPDGDALHVKARDLWSWPRC